MEILMARMFYDNIQNLNWNSCLKYMLIVNNKLLCALRKIFEGNNFRSNKHYITEL
jgi:hypothetical protein